MFKINFDFSCTHIKKKKKACYIVNLIKHAGELLYICSTHRLALFKWQVICVIDIFIGSSYSLIIVINKVKNHSFFSHCLLGVYAHSQYISLILLAIKIIVMMIISLIMIVIVCLFNSYIRIQLIYPFK